MENKGMLGKEGLTQTSANHIANMAKESYEALEARLESLRFVNRDYTLAVNGQSYRVENESDKDDLHTIIDSLREIASLKSLIAWLREGIKAKENLAKNGWQEHLEQLRKAGTPLDPPELESNVTFEEVLASKTTQEQERYYAMEAKCATFGKCIHEKGPFAKARDFYYEKKKNPTDIVGNGQDAEVNTYSTTFSPEELDETFFEIQQRYRTAQAELNKMKADIDAEVDERNKAINREYQAAYESYMAEYRTKEIEFNQQVKALKILIPEALKTICDKVSALSKEKK